MFNFLKSLFSKSGCKDCTWWAACDACSAKLGNIDKELKERYEK